MYRKLQYDSAVPPPPSERLYTQLIKVCMLTLWLCDGCLQEFSLPQKLYICRGAKCLESFCQGCEHFLNNWKVRPEVIFSSQPATDEDNKRTASVWDGLRRKARRCKCIVVACWRGKKKKRKISATMEFSLTSQMSVAALHVSALQT